MSLTLFTCQGGAIVLPAPTLVLVDRQAGGNLLVNPPREVWERSELSATELTQWAFLVAATGKAMLDVLPQLTGGCLNYWEAGNWALHEQAEPLGPKTAPAYRRVHLHLLGRNPASHDPAWRWGEAPKFPDFNERHTWAAQNQRLSPVECCKIVAAAERLLLTKYKLTAEQITPWARCSTCGYPVPQVPNASSGTCVECQLVSNRFQDNAFQ